VSTSKTRSDAASVGSASDAVDGAGDPSRVPLHGRRNSTVPDQSGARPLSAREREIFELRASGWTLREIGQRYGISRQRVDEIVRDRGGPQLPEVLAARRARTAEIISERSAEICEWWRAGLSIAEISERLDLPTARVHREIGKLLDPIDEAHRNRAIVTRTRSRRYSDEDLIAGLQAVAKRVDRTPTQEEYRALAQELRYASILTLGKRFGSWHEAVVAAGLTPLPRARRQGSQYRWDKEACWEALEKVADQLGNPPRFQSYVALSTGREDLPSGPTVRNQLGRWIDIVIELAARQNKTHAPRGKAKKSAATRRTAARRRQSAR
jgi:DNA-binding CsgD family transcriptional regulator